MTCDVTDAVMMSSSHQVSRLQNINYC